MQTKKHFKIFGAFLAVLCAVTLISSSAITGFAAEAEQEVAAQEVVEHSPAQDAAQPEAVTEAVTEAPAEQPATEAAEEQQEEEEPAVPAFNNAKTDDEEISAALNVPDPKLSNTADGIKLEWAEVPDAEQYYVCGTESGSGVWRKYYTTNLTYTFTNIPSGKQYLFQVQAIGEDGSKSAFSKARGLTYLSVPAQEPIVNSFEDDGTLRLSWSSVPGANKYKIAKIRSDWTDYEYIDVASTSYIDTAVYDGYTYRYQIRAMYQTPKNGTAYGWWSSSRSAKIAVWPNITPANCSDGIRTTWDPVKNTARYIVFCREASQSTWMRAVTTGLSYTFKGLQSGKLYYCQLYSDSISGKDGKFSNVKSIIYLAQPTISGVSVGANNVVNVSWSKVAGATKYQVARKLSGAKSFEYFYVNGTSYADHDVALGKYCAYQVRAVRESDDGETYGYWSSAKVGELFTKPDFSLISNQSNGIHTEFKIGNASSYTVYYKASTDSGWSSEEVKGNSFTITSAQSGKLYFLQLRYTGMGGGKSPFSDVKSITFTKQGTLLSVSASNTTVNLRWAAIDGVDYYVLERYNENTGKKTSITVNDATDYKDTGINYEQTYFYRVCGVHRETEKHKVYSNAAGAYSSQIRMNPKAYTAVNIALAQQGQKGYKFCNEMNNGNLNEWCAFFAGWALKQAGFDLKKCGYHGNVGVWCDNLYANGTFEYSEDYIPVQGDVIIFGTSTFRSHIGIVVGVSNGYVTTIEGNAAVPASYSGEWMANSYVVKKQYELDNYRIYGYGRMTPK